MQHREYHGHKENGAKKPPGFQSCRYIWIDATHLLFSVTKVIDRISGTPRTERMICHQFGLYENWAVGAGGIKGWNQCLVCRIRSIVEVTRFLGPLRVVSGCGCFWIWVFSFWGIYEVELLLCAPQI